MRPVEQATVNKQGIATDVVKCSRAANKQHLGKKKSPFPGTGMGKYYFIRTEDRQQARLYRQAHHCGCCYCCCKRVLRFPAGCKLVRRQPNFYRGRRATVPREPGAKAWHRWCRRCG